MYTSKASSFCIVYVYCKLLILKLSESLINYKPYSVKAQSIKYSNIKIKTDENIL